MSTSRREILRSSSIIGVASAANALFGLLRMKAAALLLGPAGVGLAGLLQNAMTTGGTLASLGISTVGAGQVAEAAGRDDEVAGALARRALRLASLALAVIGGGSFWLARDAIARALGDPGLAGAIGWLALGVSLTVLSGAQYATLTGLRRIGDVARTQIGGGVLAALIGIGAIWGWGSNGLALFVVAVPLGGFLVGLALVARLPRLQAPRGPWRELAARWSDLARLGLAFTAAGLASGIGQLAVRALIGRGSGSGDLGQFQAAWTISMTYLGFVLQATGTDYFPRLSAPAHDHAAARRMINDQAEVAMLLASPALLLVTACAPWGVRLLYSNQFTPAAELLRWQVLGDVFKVLSYPLGFLLLARGEGRPYFWAELVTTVALVGVTALLLPLTGVWGASAAFVAMYAVYLPLMTGIARARIGFRWRPETLRLGTVLFAACLSVIAIARWNEIAATALGLAFALAAGSHAFIRLRSEDPRRAPDQSPA